MNQHDELLSWLRDAYAMEKGIVQTLVGHSVDAAHAPELRERIEAHRAASERHAEMVKGCIEQLGGSVSTIKTGLALGMGMFTGMSGTFAEDVVVKNTLSEIATEHFEIACYSSLIAAAQQLEEEEIAMVCEQIVAEDQEMAQWLEEHLPLIALKHLQSHPVA